MKPTTPDMARGHLTALCGTVATLATYISANGDQVKALLTAFKLPPTTIAAVVTLAIVYLGLLKAFKSDPNKPETLADYDGRVPTRLPPPLPPPRDVDSPPGGITGPH